MSFAKHLNLVVNALDPRPADPGSNLIGVT